MKYVQKASFERKIYVRSKFSCVCSSHNLCARTHAHGLEGTLLSSPCPTSSTPISYQFLTFPACGYIWAFTYTHSHMHHTHTHRIYLNSWEYGRSPSFSISVSIQTNIFTSEKYIKNVQNYLLAMRVCPKFYVKKWATEHTSSFWGLQRKHCLQYENRVSKEVGKSYVLYSTLVSSPGWISFLLDALHFAHPNLECLSQSGDEYPTEKLK